MSLKTDIDQLVANAALVHSWTQGSSTTSVTMGGAAVRSPAKLIADYSTWLTTNMQALGTVNPANVLFTGGSINGTPIGSTTPSTGAFTTVLTNNDITVDKTGTAILSVKGTTGSNYYGYSGTTLITQLQSAISRTYLNSVTNVPIDFGVNDVVVATMSSTGLAVTGTIKGTSTIGVGNTTPAASGAGITFPATQSASSDANTLDDYEEGYHTPVTITCSTSGTVTLNTNYDTLAYTKIGRKVTVTGDLVISSVSSPVGYFDISLPFAVANLTDFSGVSLASIFCVSPVSATLTQFVSRAMGASSVLSVYLGDVAGGALQSDSAQELKASTEIYLQLTYFTA